MADDAREQLLVDLVYAGAGALAPKYPMLPFIAPVVVLALRTLSEGHRENFREVMGRTSELTSDMTHAEFETSFARPVFGRLFDASLPGVMRADTDARRNAFARVLEAGLRADDVTAERLRAVATILEEVDDAGLLWLEYFSQSMTMRQGDEFFARYPQLRRTPPVMTSSRSEILQYRLAGVSFRKLELLGLIERDRRPLSLLAREWVSREPQRAIAEIIGYIEERDRPIGGDYRLTELGRLVHHVVKHGSVGLREEDSAEGRDANQRG